MRADQTTETEREFRTARWVVVLVGGSSVGSLALSIISFRVAGWSFTTLALTGLSVLFAVGFADTVTARVVLKRDRIEVVSNFRRTVVPRSDLVRAQAEKGAPIALARASGGWLKLPGALAGPHINTVNAWLARTGVPGGTDTES